MTADEERHDLAAQIYRGGTVGTAMAPAGREGAGDW
jgi:hypothetical protein